MSSELQTAPDPRYPVGKFDRSVPITDASLEEGIAAIAAMPAELAKALAGLSEAQLDTPYREGGWTVRQLVHHIADSHLNALSRNKLALTEEFPTIYAYNEKAWAELADSDAPVEVSVSILTGLHQRWVMLLKSLKPEDWKRGFNHPERGVMTLDVATMLYAWHCKHHVAHIAALRTNKGW